MPYRVSSLRWLGVACLLSTAACSLFFRAQQDACQSQDDCAPFESLGSRYQCVEGLCQSVPHDGGPSGLATTETPFDAGTLPLPDSNNDASADFAKGARDASNANDATNANGAQPSTPRSCLDAFTRFGTQNGLQTIAPVPTGGAATTPFKTYCYGDAENGYGWTLALKINGASTDSRFFFDSEDWKRPTPLVGADAVDVVSDNELKLRSFSEVPVKNVLLQARMLRGASRTVKVPLATLKGSLLAAVNGDTVVTGVPESDWFSLFPDAGVQLNCRQQGLSIFGTSGARARVRIGIIGNNESAASECASHDSYLGVGGQVTTTRCSPELLDAGRPNGVAAGFVGGGLCGGNSPHTHAGYVTLVYVREN
jgi:hypothetical protein